MIRTYTVKAAALGVALMMGAGAASPAFSASLGTGALQAKPANAAPAEVGYWYRGRWYEGCWNCGRPNNGAAVGAGIALGILGAAAIAGAAAEPAYPPPGPPPVVYYEAPGPTVYVAPPPVHHPRQCWVETDGRGYGYWTAC